MNKINIAFICVHNSCRSQIAEALGKLLLKDIANVFSAGTEVKDKINVDAVRLMKQLYGINMEKTQRPKLISELPPIDYVITMGCNVNCPYLPCKKREDWGLDDPSGKSDEEFLKTIKAIESKLKNLKNKILKEADMKKLIIEWRHLDIDGETCNRCYDTGENLYNEVTRLNRSLQSEGISVEWFETKLDKNQVNQSNALLFNGTPIEDILSIKVSENFCESCSSLLGEKTFCRTVTYEGEEYEDIPAKAIRNAAYKVLNIDKAKSKNEVKTRCCNGKGCC